MKIVIVEKTGTVKTQNVKNFEIDTLYKKCLFRKSDDFNKRHTWEVKINNKMYNVALYAKDKGKATTENKYDLPPPVDKVIYYGSMALVNFNTKNGDETDVTDFTSEEWEKIYEKLFGGFEDIEDTDDEEEEDELANIPKKYLTKKGGYLKDGFVVDTASEDETYETDESEKSKEKTTSKNTIVKSHNKQDKKDELDEQDKLDNSDSSDSECSDQEEIDHDVEDQDADEDDASYEGESDSDSDNSSELSESVYCEYSDEH